ncbi:uncharacterized protein LOC128656059 isoform X2 [Bombina bombina]|uniref:uncharacterized protein LOC128656059 isoform X2 n=1 Tax=Bombina bombina TaxID=8345 RepID=UPI00235AF21C|nr:uncharacterized protein LOC128656059 isoform X2 [Bombina bombina]
MMDSLLTRHILLFTLLFTETSSKTIVVPEGINTTVKLSIGEELTLIVDCNITSENFEFRVHNRTNTNKTPLISTKIFGDFSDELGKYKLHVTPSYVAFTINKVEEMNLVMYRLQVEKRDGLCNSNVRVKSENHGTDPEAAQKGKRISHENHGTDPEAAQKGESISHEETSERSKASDISTL